MAMKTNGFYEVMEDLADFEELAGALQKNITPINVAGVSDSVRAHLAFCVSEKFQAPVLLVAENEVAAMEIADDLRFFSGAEVLYYGNSDILFYDVDVKSHEIQKQRLEVLDYLFRNKGKQTYVVTTYSALLSVTIPFKKYQENVITLKVGDDIELEALIGKFESLGYKREELVEGAGQFSVRGGILDYFPYYSQYPLRIEFFDTEVDSIRTFDKDSQRTIDRCDEARITPAGELVPDDKERTKLAKKLNSLLADTEKPVSEKSASALNRDIERLNQGIRFPSIEKYIPYIYREKPTILDYLTDDTIIFWCDGRRISEAYEGDTARFAEDTTEMAERGIIPKADMEYFLPLKKAVKRLTAHRFVGVSGISNYSAEYRAKRTYAIGSKSLAGFQGKLEFLYESLRFYKSSQYRTVVLGGSEIRAKNLLNQLENEGFNCAYTDVLTELPPPGGIVITHGSISHGFEFPSTQTVVISDKEIFGHEKKKRKRYGKVKGEKIDNFTDLNMGDYVVHRNYGIGQYIGIEQLNVDGVRKDYLKIRFKGDDFLYVPTDQLDMVYKHIAKDGARIKMNKLGGGEWSRTKQRVKAAAADMAKELIDLYAKRANTPGISFPKDDEWQSDFEAKFPFEETDDQLRSIQEMKEDMEKPYPMDRLLCGDVGYGKTEVALRGAFKAVMAGYQVAYLVPTTILATQHFNTFKQRMKDYPINVAMLSRFCTSAEEKRIVKGLATGEIDVVIGTHKLLGKQIKYNKLGLLVIDEEQRFGVAHKEKIKEIRKEVDVLTLSATPIPRTLHMSLTGIRDMSIINEPPAERFPISTYVLEYDEDVIREAINKELGRGGQVYYLYNRIDGIFKVANRIAELVPSARIAVAHGRMHENELEQIMMDVSDGTIDVLVCTTIIETGLDIPNVNTIILENADRLGLAQLYQLRGRVGRSNRLAYAYLTYRRNKSLTPEAEKRLLAIKEFTEFGSGFKIAMRDLEIRGTGNLIGAQQHGHMEAVGYEMYCRLLEEATAEIKGIETKNETETQIDLPVSAYISDKYIKNHSQRIAAYKRIAAIKNQDELYDAYDEIEDRYGTVPPEVENLMEVALIKAYASSYNITEVIGNSERITVKFDPENIPDMKPCLELIDKYPGKISILTPNNPKLAIKLVPLSSDKGGKNYLGQVKEMMSFLSEQYKANLNKL